MQAQIAALHDQAPRVQDTNWREIAGLYGFLEQLTGNPMVSPTTSVPENHYLTMRAARLNERRKTRGG